MLLELKKTLPELDATLNPGAYGNHGLYGKRSRAANASFAALLRAGGCERAFHKADLVEVRARERHAPLPSPFDLPGDRQGTGGLSARTTILRSYGTGKAACEALVKLAS